MNCEVGTSCYAVCFDNERERNYHVGGFPFVYIFVISEHDEQNCISGNVFKIIIPTKEIFRCVIFTIYKLISLVIVSLSWLVNIGTVQGKNKMRKIILSRYSFHLLSTTVKS